MSERTIFESTQRVGTTEDGGYVVLEVSIDTTPGEWQTSTHGTVTNPLCLHIVGEAYEKRDRRGDPSRAGQCVDALDDVTAPAAGWTLDEVREVKRIWEEWHLNTMTAGCAHQTVVWEDKPYRRPSLELTLPCPHTGYRYGSAWLAIPLTEHIVERVKHLFRDRSHDLYLERGYDAAGNAYPPKEN